jgi:hypothetical protein
MASSALSPLGVAVFGVLQDATLLAATPGGWHDSLPENPTYPCGWYELFTSRTARGLGIGEMAEVELRTHVYHQRGVAGGALAEAQEIDRQVRALLEDAALTVTGYRQAGLVFYDNTDTLDQEEVNGVKVYEIVSFYRVYVEI